LKRKSEFKEIDEEIDQKAEVHAMNKAKIAQSLFSGGDKGAGALFAKKLNQKMEGDYIIHEEMERKRREEEALVAQQEREKRENDLQSAQSLR